MADRKKYRQAGRQADRQTDRWTIRYKIAVLITFCYLVSSSCATEIVLGNKVKGTDDWSC